MRWFTATLLMATIAFVGCGGSYSMRSTEFTTSPWPVDRGTVHRTGSIGESQFGSDWQIAWQHRRGDRPEGPLALAHHRLIYPSSRKRLVFFVDSTGDRSGQTKLKGVAQSGLAVADSLLTYALRHKKNRIEGYDLRRGDILWKRPLKDPGPGPIVLNNRIIAAGSDGVVMALDPRTGSVHWQHNWSARWRSGPTVHDSLLLMSTDNAVWLFSAESGDSLGVVEIPGTVVGHVAVGAFAIAASLDGTVIGFEPSSGQLRWSRQLGPEFWASPAVSDGHVAVVGTDGRLLVLREHDGTTVWERELGEVVTAAPLVAGNHLILGTQRGTLFVLDHHTGALITRFQFVGGFTQAPITDGTRVYLATDRGTVAALEAPRDQHAIVPSHGRSSAAGLP